MDVNIDGRVIRLDERQVIGVGGEGTVFLADVGGQRLAVKVYHTPTRQREEKLQTFLARTWQLPREKIALPLQLVRDVQHSRVIGLTMPYLDSGFEELARLAHKKQRTTHGISTKQVAGIFLDGAKSLADIHTHGLVVGDFNDRNILYRQQSMLWIDVDAWQFAEYACPVGSEDFLAPELYDIDLSLKPVFQPKHDWYAYAVHLFRSLLLAHPYGGTHATVQALTQRAQQRLFILRPAVTYPKLAYSPDLLGDELAEVFERIFAQGWRGIFPIAVLQRYADTLVPCSACMLDYPHTRRTCPVCQTRMVVTMQQKLSSATGVSMTELLHTEGKIVFAKVQGDTLSVLTYEDGKAVLYTIPLAAATSRQAGKTSIYTLQDRKELFQEIAGARYDLLDTTLLVNAPGTTRLLCVNVAGEGPVAVCETVIGVFAQSRQAVFQASDRYVFAILNNRLMYSVVEHGILLSRPLRTVMEQQTWFAAAPTTYDGKLSVFGFFSVLRQQMYWLIHGHTHYDVPLTELDTEEALLDMVAYFAQQSVLIRRHTQERGVDYLHTEIVNYAGMVVYASSKMRRADHPYPSLHGLVYAHGILLHPSDKGIVQENVEEGTFKTFSATQNSVQEGDALELYHSGLLIISEHQVRYLELH